MTCVAAAKLVRADGTEELIALDESYREPRFERGLPVERPEAVAA